MKSFLKNYSRKFEDSILGLIGEFAGHGHYKLVFCRTLRRNLGKILIVNSFSGEYKKLHKNSWGKVYDWDKMRLCVKLKEALDDALLTIQSFPSVNEYDPGATRYLQDFSRVLHKTRSENCLLNYSLTLLGPYRLRLIRAIART